MYQFRKMFKVTVSSLNQFNFHISASGNTVFSSVHAIDAQPDHRISHMIHYIVQLKTLPDDKFGLHVGKVFTT